MSSIDEHRSLASWITNFKANTLKGGRDRFSQGFLRGRVDLLQDYWRRFQIAHEALLEDDALLQDEYFTENLFATVELEYTSSIGFLYD